MMASARRAHGVTVLGAGHDVHLDEPARLSDLIAEFIGDHSSR